MGETSGVYSRGMRVRSLNLSTAALFCCINLQALGTWQILCTATAPTNGGGVRDAMRKSLLVKAEALRGAPWYDCCLGREPASVTVKFLVDQMDVCSYSCLYLCIYSTLYLYLFIKVYADKYISIETVDMNVPHYSHISIHLCFKQIMETLHTTPERFCPW